jgi:hypothetical protein
VVPGDLALRRGQRGTKNSGNLRAVFLDGEGAAGDREDDLYLIVSLLVVWAVRDDDAGVGDFVGVTLTFGEFTLDKITPVLLHFSVPPLNVNLHSVSFQQESFRTLETAKVDPLVIMMAEFSCTANSRGGKTAHPFHVWLSTQRASPSPEPYGSGKRKSYEITGMKEGGGRTRGASVVNARARTGSIKKKKKGGELRLRKELTFRQNGD